MHCWAGIYQKVVITLVFSSSGSDFSLFSILYYPCLGLYLNFLLSLIHLTFKEFGLDFLDIDWTWNFNLLVYFYFTVEQAWHYWSQTCYSHVGWASPGSGDQSPSHLGMPRHNIGIIDWEQKLFKNQPADRYTRHNPLQIFSTTLDTEVYQFT